jgi:hypothetical protein
MSAASPRISPRASVENWIEDWRVMSQQERLELQRALIVDYSRMPPASRRSPDI